MVVPVTRVRDSEIPVHISSLIQTEKQKAALQRFNNNSKSRAVSSQSQRANIEIGDFSSSLALAAKKSLKQEDDDVDESSSSSESSLEYGIEDETEELKKLKEAYLNDEIKLEEESDSKSRPSTRASLSEVLMKRAFGSTSAPPKLKDSPQRNLKTPRVGEFFGSPEKQSPEKSSMDTDNSSFSGQQLFPLKRPGSASTSKANAFSSIFSPSPMESIEESDEEDSDVGATGTVFSTYFKRMGQEKEAVTSSNSFISLFQRTGDESSKGKLDLLKLQSIIEGQTQNHGEERMFLAEMFSTMYQQWFFELACHFNLLFYGFGSKKNLLEDFCLRYVAQKQNKCDLLIVNGFSPVCSIKEISSNLGKIIFGQEESNSSPQFILDQLFQGEKPLLYFNQGNRIILLIHNIDGVALRNPKTLSIVAKMASHPNIYLVASVDHINSSFLWDKKLCSIFNWIHHDLTTFERYHVEVDYQEESACLLGISSRNKRNISSKTGIMTVSGIRNVLVSLTENSRGIFRILGSHQLKCMEKLSNNCSHNDYPWHEVGLPPPVLFNKCREKFLVHHETTFRTQLTEFHDHQLILQGQGSVSTSNSKNTSIEILYIPLEFEMLEQIINELDNGQI